MENLKKKDLLELAKAYETIILTVADDLHEGKEPDQIYYRIYKDMQSLSAKYFGEVM